MRIRELTLYTTSMDDLRRFYTGVLGLRQIEPARFGRLAVQAGSSRLYFEAVPAGTGDAGPFRYHFAFDVPPRRFDAAVRWLDQRGGPIASPEGKTTFHGSWNNDSVYFADPQGNILELIARHSLPESDFGEAVPDRPFDAVEIISISEIGLAADAVADAAGSLMARLPGLDLYAGEGSDTFTALGDHYGLLIMVQRGRIWFPETGVPAQFLPLGVLIELENGSRYRISAPPYPFTTRPAG